MLLPFIVSYNCLLSYVWWASPLEEAVRRRCAWYGSSSDRENASKEAEARKRPAEPLAGLSRRVRHLCQCRGGEPAPRPPASPAPARPDAGCPPGNSVQCSPLRPATWPPSLRWQGRRTLSFARGGRVLGAAVLAVAIFTLLASFRPALIHHLHGVGGNHHVCPVRAGHRTAHAGGLTASVVPVFALFVAGLTTLQHQSPVPAPAILPFVSRAPPVMG
jgi:hypothetical protein